MSVKTDLERAVPSGPDEAQDEVPEKLNPLFRLSKIFAEMKIESILRFYRLASFMLSSLLFLLFPGNYPIYAQLSLLFLILAISILMVALYEHYWRSMKVMVALVSFEILGISLLLAFTGGFNGPFLWFALNPFIVATAFFRFALVWLFIGLMLAVTFLWKLYIFANLQAATEIFGNNYYPALNLIVIVMIMHLFARMHMNISDQSQEKRSQRLELMSAYQNLSANYQVFKGLSNFQREVVYYKNQRDIYSALIDTLLNIFPFRQAAVLLPPPEFHSNINGNISSFQVLSSDKANRDNIDQYALEEIEDRWDEFTRRGKKRLVISKARDWVALPLHGESHIITAIFVGWINPKTNPLSFAENLSLFISFAEQTTDWLSMFKQKERVLQHISSIYEAVEAVSSQNNPRQVIDLFASYARALTDCDKTIFWMESTGSGEYDDPSPIYSVKGPRDCFPEEEWQDTLLNVWSDVHKNQVPVFVDLHSQNHGRAQLICVPVRSGDRCLGMLAGIQSNNTYSAHEIKQTLSILADLSAIAVERTRTEMFAEKLLIVDEQKRIANEIHDSISQNLFSIVYSIDSLTKETAHILGLGYREVLNDIKNLSAETARELRALIYRLNPRQDANESFTGETRNYLDKLSRMNNIKIDYIVSGNTEFLNPAMCKALYRILKESSGNALRHGKCTEIIVNLEITPFQSVLKVSDNGKGFDVRSSLDLYTAGNRLGLVNMRELAIALQGTLDIKSKAGRGTEVTCIIPTSPVSVQ